MERCWPVARQVRLRYVSTHLIEHQKGREEAFWGSLGLSLVGGAAGRAVQDRPAVVLLGSLVVWRRGMLRWMALLLANLEGERAVRGVPHQEEHFALAGPYSALQYSITFSSTGTRRKDFEGERNYFWGDRSNYGPVGQAVVFGCVWSRDAA